ncbi:MAG: circularly permuted type 2 ATP-grasp protein [Pseudomonadota bacterium]
MPSSSSLAPFPPADYPDLPSNWDEMWDPAAGVRPHWAELVSGLSGLGARDWAARNQRIKRLLRENGVTYHVYDDPRGYSRTWELDPLPLVLDAAEWQTIEAGLDQRARLLDLLLRDLYGPQQALRRGLLPPELILAHAGYLRPLQGALPTGRRQLIFYAADLVRGPDGRVWVMADRTQSPSGAGYALENRSVMARTFPEFLEGDRVTRLNAWLDAVQATLNGLAPWSREMPQVVVLTPGPANETYFEHAYLAARLGYTLAQGDDLTVKDGRVWLKTVEGLKPVDVILRRLDEEWCDPLELRQDSRLGTAGLVEAVRRGSVALANPLGSGLLENPAILPFLPALARHLLGEELLLPTAATWWCGQEKERKYVLANLNRLVIKPINRGLSSETVFGGDLDRRQLAAWKARIQAEPHLYVGQEPLSLSTVPAIQAGRMVPHRASLRTFAVGRAEDEGYAVLPGGLTRCVAGGKLSGQSGALNKDTWIVPAQASQAVLRAPPRRREQSLLTSRAADNLFWAGRYLERAEAVARLLRTVLDGLWEEETAPGLAPVLTALMALMGYAPGQCGCGDRPDLAACVRELTTLGERPGNLAQTVRALLGCAYGTREYWSVAIWRLLDRVERDWGQGSKRPKRVTPSQERTDLWLGRLIDTLAGLAGLASETLPRESAFRFFDLGRRVERGLTQATLLAHTLDSRLGGEAERESLSLVLQSADSLVTFRRRYRTEPFLAGVLELLLWDGDSPRSLLYQLKTARRHLAELSHASLRSNAERLLFSAEDRLYATENTITDLHVDADERLLLSTTLGELRSLLAGTSDAIGHTWFTHVQELHALRPLPPEPEED